MVGGGNPNTSPPHLLGAFYLDDDSRTHFARVGAFATDVSTELREFSLREGLARQAAAEHRTLRIVSETNKLLSVSAGAGTVGPACIPFIPVMNQDDVLAIDVLASSAPVSQQQQTPLDTLIPTVALHTKILPVNL
jgi:hypothetical protein